MNVSKRNSYRLLGVLCSGRSRVGMDTWTETSGLENKRRDHTLLKKKR